MDARLVNWVVAVMLVAALGAGWFFFLRDRRGPAEAREEVSVVSQEDDVPLIPEMGFVRDELSGIDVEVTASDTAVVDGKGYETGTEAARVLELADPVFRVRDDEGTTELAGRFALLDPAEKTVVFEQGAYVMRGRDTLLECDRVVWHYSRAEIAVECAFTLRSGKGILSGERLVADIGFKDVRVQ